MVEAENKSNGPFCVSDTGGIGATAHGKDLETFEQIYSDTSRKFGGPRRLETFQKLVEIQQGEIWRKVRKAKAVNFSQYTL